ncbi:hypothetical protein [Streptomyces sp. NPDC057694]|uniref:hypothetical protein n=1 Tax=Streptomyces sp. NPDC057694 TaxID=3346216 RepID=UPI0036BB0B85
MTAFIAADLERLAKLVRERRVELQLGIEPAAKLAGISKDTWRRVEDARLVRATTYSAMDRTLDWAVGSCERITVGEDPIPSTAASDDSGSRIHRIPKGDLERSVGDAVASAAMATKGSLTASEILELNERVLQELRDRGIL